jgi:hypothetical protein
MLKTLTKFKIVKHGLLLNVIFLLLSLCIVNSSFGDEKEAEDFPWEIFYPAFIKKSIDKDKDGIVYYANPGDSRAATFTIDGQSCTIFGPKDSEGGLRYINHARIDSPDGDPMKRAFLDFDADGSPVRAILGSGETMSFEWVSSTKVYITYQNADGTQVVHFLYEESNGSGEQTEVSLNAASEPRSTINPAEIEEPEPIVKVNDEQKLVTQGNSNAATGIIKVTCGQGVPVTGAKVTVVADPEAYGFDNFPVSPIEIIGGTFEYVLPTRPAPNPLEEFHATRYQAAKNLACLGNGAIILSGTARAWLCAQIGVYSGTGVIGSGGCYVMMAAYAVWCAYNTSKQIVHAVNDYWWDAYTVKVTAKHPKLGIEDTEVKVVANSNIPVGLIQYTNNGGISKITLKPIDPVPGQSYWVTAETICVPYGVTLKLSIDGSDGYHNATSVVISETTNKAILLGTGSQAGVTDTIKAELIGSVSDSITRYITF